MPFTLRTELTRCAVHVFSWPLGIPIDHDLQEKIDAFLPVLDGMMSSGLVTIEKVRVLQYGTDPVSRESRSGAPAPGRTCACFHSASKRRSDPPSDRQAQHARGRRIYEGQHQQNALPVGEIRDVVLGYGLPRLWPTRAEIRAARGFTSTGTNTSEPGALQLAMYPR